MNKLINRIGKAVLAANLVVIMTPQLFADDKLNRERRGGGSASDESQKPHSKPQREEPRQESPRQEQRPPQQQEMRREQRPQPEQKPITSAPPAQNHPPRQESPRQEAPRQEQRPPQQQETRREQRPPQQNDQNRPQNPGSRPDYRQPEQPRQEQRPPQQYQQPPQNNYKPVPPQQQRPDQNHGLYPQRPGQWDRGQSQRNIDDARHREQQWRNNYGNARVNTVSNNYHNSYNTVIVNRTTYINNYYNQPNYRNRYVSYHNLGFRSGYYYPVRPCYEIHTYFNYPVLYWMYVSSVDVDYYRSWYAGDYNYYPVSTFQYARVYYPSESIRDLGMEVSAMPSRNQAYFRTALVNLTQALAQQIANNINYNFRLAENDIVVTEYQNLQNRAIVMEGFVDRDGIHAGFKAFLDLEDPNQTLVFVPINNYPTEQEQYTLRIINDRIYNLGGNPYQN